MPKVEQDLNDAVENIRRTFRIAFAEKGINQVTAARFLGVTQSQVNRAVRGDDSPSSRKIRAGLYRLLDIRN